MPRPPLALIALLILAPACGPERRRITPTTGGTDLRALPRGRMAPQPFPGSSLARAEHRPTVDRQARVAGGEVEPAR